VKTREGRVVSVLLAIAFATSLTAQTPPQNPAPPPAPPEYHDLDALLASLPAATPPTLDEPRAHWLVALPLACLDQLQARPTSRPYFWDATFKPVDGYDKNRAFYGCNDWHSAVNATWTVVKLLKQFPALPEGQLIREKLNDHLGKSNFDGELAYFKDATTFERPYGYAWLLKLHAELVTWDDPQAAEWAGSVAPLAKFFSEKLVDYLKDLDQVTRSGGQTNTALSLGLMLDAIDVLPNYALKAVVVDTAKKFYTKDAACATESETTGADVASPCLTEAALMSRVLDQAAFVSWLDKFLPPAYSPKFRPLTTIAIDLSAPGRGRAGNAARTAGAAAPAGGPPAAGTDQAAAGGRGAGGGAGGSAGGGAGGRGAGGAPGPGGNSARANPVGLAFERAEALNRLANALPSGDKRIVIFRRLSAIHGEKAAQALSDPAVLDAPWLGACAISYMRSAK
jgi:hypothetical protein